MVVLFSRDLGSCFVSCSWEAEGCAESVLSWRNFMLMLSRIQLYFYFNFSLGYLNQRMVRSERRGLETSSDSVNYACSFVTEEGGH